MTLLKVENLSTNFRTEGGVVKAVRDVSFSIAGGESLGIVGESGCGKTVMSLSILRLIQSPPGSIDSGKILFTGDGTEKDLLKISENEMRSIRGKSISMVFQEPMTSLDPVFTIGSQIAEAISVHENISKKKLDERVLELLNLVGIPDPARRVKEYPHELSGGQRQRAMIAMALSLGPKLLIADEPTTALDVTIQAQVLDLIRRLRRELNMSLMIVTHDLGVVAEMTDRVIVMYAGEVVEEGTTLEIFGSPKHPYTEGLLKSVRALDGERSARLPTIPGQVPSLINIKPGCLFADRCYKVKDECRKQFIAEDPCNVGRTARCLFVEK